MTRVVSISTKLSGSAGLHVVPVAPSRPLPSSDDVQTGSVRVRSGKRSGYYNRAAAGKSAVSEADTLTKRKPLGAFTTALQVLRALYTWALWALVVALVGSRFLGIVWNTSVHEGGATSLFPFASGMRNIIEADESPYSDRSIACLINKRRYSPKQLHLTVSTSGVAASSVDADTRGINGFRVTPRGGSPLTLTDEARTSYTTMCNVMAAIADPILDSCESLGYNVTRDALRVVPSVDGNELVYLPDSLPMLILPYSDNLPYARVAVPGWDGSACMFRLEGISTDSITAGAISSSAAYYMLGADREDREALITQQVHSFTGTNTGAWRNGWYEVELSDGSSSRWFGDAISSVQEPNAEEINAPQRQFMLQASGAKELDCSVAANCKSIIFSEAWTLPQITMAVITSDFTSAIVTNASRFGSFYKHFHGAIRIISQYDLATFISDVSVLAGLLRWGAALAALHVSHAFRQQIPYHNAGIGVLSCSRSFNFIPILLLPRLRIILAAFATLGLGGHAAQNAGDQSALVNAWFVVYPATAELLVYFYCLLNWVGILFKRRMTDALFGPTLIALCLLHYCRDAITSVWFEEDTTLSPPIEASEFDAAGLLPLFTSDLLAQLSGGGSKKEGTHLFTLKLVLLSINALPMLIPSRFTSFQARSRGRSVACETEQTLAFRASKIGGLGVSDLYGECDSEADGADRPMLLDSYEVARLGYVIVGDKFLVGISDWYKLLLLSPMRFVRRPTNIRVVLFVVHTVDKDRKTARESLGRVAVVRDGPIIVRVNDPRLRSVKLTDISIASFH